MNITLTIPLSSARAMLELAEDQSTHSGYGVFPGGDPRCFTPDSDSLPEEIEASQARVRCVGQGRASRLGTGRRVCGR